jgi:hypothetical protein
MTSPSRSVIHRYGFKTMLRTIGLIILHVRPDGLHSEKKTNMLGTGCHLDTSTVQLYTSTEHLKTVYTQYTEYRQLMQLLISEKKCI